MAKKTIVQLVDDIDGTEIEDGKGGTVRFGLDQTVFEIDLSDKNATAFRRLFTEYVDKARVVGQMKTGNVAARSSGNRNSKEELAAAREWLRASGHEVSDKGRIPAALLELYRSSK